MTPGATQARGRGVGLCWPLAFAIGLVGFALPSKAQNRLDRRHVGFDIPAQSLDTALEVFSEASGYQILTAEAGAGTTQANAVRGFMLPRKALARLLEGTGLKAQFTGDQAAIIVRDPLDALRLKDQRAYDAELQSAVIAALCRDATTRPGPYRAALDVWVSEAGRIERAELLHSTGDSLRDHLIVAALHALNAIAPPPGLVQPITLLVLPSARSTQTCDPSRTDEKASTR